jgi:hypothetical protein
MKSGFRLRMSVLHFLKNDFRHLTGLWILMIWIHHSCSKNDCNCWMNDSGWSGNCSKSGSDCWSGMCSMTWRVRMNDRSKSFWAENK